MIHRHIAPVETHEDRLSLLASLPQEMLGDFLKHHFKEQSVPWLNAAVEAGCFDLSGEVFERTYTTSKDVSAISEAVDVALSFLNSSTRCEEIQEDPQTGDLRLPMHVLYLDYEDDFSDSFDALVSHFCDDYKQTMDRIKSLSSATRVDIRIDIEDAAMAMFAKLMVGAIALDRPDTLRRLLRANPDAFEEAFDPGELCRELNDGGLMLTPYGFAMQFSQIECMEAIEAAYFPRVPVVCRKTDVFGEASLDFDALSAHQVLVPKCFPSAYAHAMTHCMDRRGGEPGFMHEAAVHAIKALSASDDETLAHYVDAFLAIGLYDALPSKAFEAAVVHGNLTVASHFKGQVPWDDLSSTADPKRSLLIDALANYANEKITQEKKDVIDLVMAMAQKDERMDLVLRVVPQPRMRYNNDTEDYNGPVFVTPIGHLLEHGMQDALHAFLQNGIELDTPLAPGAWTIQQMADAQGPTMSGLLHAFKARQRAMGVIVDIVEGPAPKRPRLMA